MEEKTKNLDLRNMIPFERHSKIFQMWNSLKKGETLRIINDHEPKPLYYQFQAEHKGKFEWQYEKQGPKEWIFKIKKLNEKTEEKKHQEEKKTEIKELIKQLHSNNTNELKKKGKEIFKNISPTDLAMIEQEIIQEGTTREEMRKLCDVHLEVMKDNLEKKEINLKPGHPIHTLIEEHKMILDFIDKLEKVTKIIYSKKNYEEINEEIKMLKHISEHLVEADKHHQREEEVLFPELEKQGITEPPEIMKEEHADLKTRKKELHNISINYRKLNFSNFVRKLKENADFLIEQLPNHIYKEDNILYPMALQVIPENNWTKIKNKCDKIGYCCFTPSY